MGTDTEPTGAQGILEPDEVSIPALDNPRGNEVTDDISDTMASTNLRVQLAPVLGGYADIAEVIDLPEGLRQKGFSVYTIGINDREGLMGDEEALRALIPHVGKIVFDVFVDRDNPEEFKPDDEEFVQKLLQKYFREGDLGSADKVYLFVKDGKTEGIYLVKYEESPEVGKVLNVLLTTVDDSCRNTGINKEMRDVLLGEEIDVNGTMGVSHTPAAVINAIQCGAKYGFTTYFGGHKNGDSDIVLTDDERFKLNAMMKLVAANLEDYGMTEFQDGMLPYYASYGKHSIPSRKMHELKFKNPENPLKKTFEEMIRWQEQYKPGEAVYGTLFSLR